MTDSLRLYPAVRSFFGAASLLCLAIFASSVPAQGQELLQGTVVVEGEARSYAIYIPSTYDSTRPNSMTLALHPMNTARWNAESWRDTLIAFAEGVGTILVCPDGGSDGSLISEKNDTLLASGLLNLVEDRYTVDPRRIYAMGFSVGGAATYLYGLANSNRFAGYLPIGAAVNGTSGFAALLRNVSGKPVYVVHGANDAPQTRYYPVIEGLDENGAILKTLLMEGVGHTIDFPNRNPILIGAFRWLDSVNTARISSGIDEKRGKGGEQSQEAKNVRLYPNPLRRDEEGTFRWNEGSLPDQLRVVDLLGNEHTDECVTLIDRSSAKILPRSLPPGVYFLEFHDHGDRWAIRFVIR